MATLNLLHQRDVYGEDPGSGGGPIQVQATSNFLYVLNDYINYGSGQNGSILVYTFDGSTYTLTGTLDQDPNGYVDMYVDSDSRFSAIESDDPDNSPNLTLRLYSGDGYDFSEIGNASITYSSANTICTATDANGTYLGEETLKAYTNDTPTLTLRDTVSMEGELVLDICIAGNYIITLDTHYIKAWTFNGTSLTNVASSEYHIDDDEDNYYTSVNFKNGYVLLCGEGPGEITSVLALYTFNGTSFTYVNEVTPPSGRAEYADYDGTYIYLANGDEGDPASGIWIYQYANNTFTLIANRFDPLYLNSCYFGIAKQGSYVHTVDLGALSAYELLSDTDYIPHPLPGRP